MQGSAECLSSPTTSPLVIWGVENVNAFNKVSPHSHQTGETAEAPAHSCKTHEHPPTVRLRETRTHRDSRGDRDTCTLTHKPAPWMSEKEDKKYTRLAFGGWIYFTSCLVAVFIHTISQGCVISGQVGSACQTGTLVDAIPPSEAARRSYQICWMKREGGRGREKGGRLNVCQSAAKWFQL